MRTLVRNALILVVALALSVWAVVPPEKKLRRGKDLAGGATLVYAVDVKPTDPPDTINKVIQVIKERLDPSGVMEISIVAQGSDRLEITMPLPSERVKELKGNFEAELAKLSNASITADEFDRVAALPGQERTKEAARLAAGDATQSGRIDNALAAYDALKPERDKFAKAQRAVVELRRQVREETEKHGPADPLVAQLQDGLRGAEAVARVAAETVAPLELAYEQARAGALTSGLNPGDLRKALSQPTAPVKVQGKDNKVLTLPSARERAMTEINTRYPDLAKEISGAVKAWGKYEEQRRSLDDPQDIVRILKGAGVLNFRITVESGGFAGEFEARNQLRAGGPRAVRVDDVRWFKVNKIENWIQNEKDLDLLKSSPAMFFMQRGNYVVEEYKGDYYMLCWDRKGLRLTENEGSWQVANAFQGADQLGRPAIDFRMDVLGASKLGQLTEGNVGKMMAVLLDDEVYTAPRLQSRIAESGQITGNFSPPEREYIIRVLSAGSLQAKLSGDPISQSIVGPQLGADNLDKGMRAGILAFVVVAGFMIAYYFGNGLISIIALVLNALMLVGAMAMNQAAFTLPGIAGIILTFGMAVDANVLIYERMREEYARGADLRTAVRLGYAKALAAIVDGNITTLIVCVVLAFTGTQEIKGFALTLGIGIATTLFAQLFCTRFIYTILVDYVRVKHMPMFATVVPVWQRIITPHIDWMGIRGLSYAFSILVAGMGVFFLFYEGTNLLGTEFRGGTQITLTLRQDENGKPVTLTRGVVEDRVKAIADKVPKDSPLANLQFAEVIAVNPQSDNVTSNTFTIKSLITDPNVVQPPLIAAFEKELGTTQALTFASHADPIGRGAPVYAINTPVLGEAVDLPDLRTPSGEFYGGLAIVLKNLTPSVSAKELQTRLDQARSKSDYSDTLGRRSRVVVVEGSDAAVKSAVVVVSDPNISYFEDERRWETDVRDREWRLLTTSLTTSQTQASVQSFSPAVASTFRNQAIVAVLLSTLLVVIYVWVRFNSIRYSIAAIATTLHDCLVAIGFVALATVLYRNYPDLAATLGILPFKIDLNVVAAMLTILGYSLNDTIIVMDRIRENRGKLHYASRHIINDAINQTISRTIITAGTTFLACIVLYIWGGEAVRVFAYTMLIGILVGTYSSIAVAAPLVWSEHAEPTKGRPLDAGGADSSGPESVVQAA